MPVPFAIDVRPSPEGDRVVEVTLDLASAQLEAGSHAAQRTLEDRYRVAPISSVDDVLAMRDLTWIADELAAPVATGMGVRLTFSVARLGRLRDALEAFVAGREDGLRRERDHELLADAHALLDGVIEAHGAAVRAALDAGGVPTFG